MPVRKISHNKRDALFGAGLVMFGDSRLEKVQDVCIKNNLVDHQSLGNFNADCIDAIKHLRQALRPEQDKENRKAQCRQHVLSLGSKVDSQEDGQKRDK